MLAGMELEWKPIADRVWLAVTPIDDANVTLVAGSRRAMLIDAGGSAEVGAAVLASARGLVDVPIEVVVVTHHHLDHWAGVAAMRELEIIGHERLLDQPHDFALAPTTTFSLIHALELGDCFVELAHFGPAHTRSDVVVIVPSRDLIVLGDLLEDEPQLDETSAPDKWPMVLDSAIGSSRASTVFVPGHGAPGTREDAALCGGKLGYTYGLVEEFVQRGVQPADLYDEAEEWPFAEATMRAALPWMVTDLERRGIVARKQLPIRGV